jgi:glycosyltransferase involved in cell wall biosynthesis
MKVILFANTDWYLFNFRLNIARTLRAKGAEVVLLSPPGDYAAKMQAEGFRWLPLPMSRKGMNPFAELQTLWRIKGVYQDEKPDVVHHFTVKCVLYGSIAAHLAGIRAIVNAVTGLGYIFSAPGLKGTLLRLLARVLYRYALHGSQVIFQNTEDRQTFINMRLLKPDAAHLIPGSGVNLGLFTPTPEPEGQPVVMFAARMLWEKGVGDFVEAAKMLKAEGVRARFVLVGDTYKDNPSAVPPQQLSAWNEEGIIEWWGWHDDMAKMLSQASIVCLPTYYKEGVPRVLTEAAAAGRAIVSSNIIGCREIVHEGINGLMVPPQNPSMLASALRKLIENPLERARMGHEGRKIAENYFAEERIVKKTFAVYEKLGFTDL